MSEVWYFIAAIALGGVITLALRAVPFALLKPLRKSRLVQQLGTWMPAGILLILALVVLHDLVVAHPSQAWVALASVAVTVLVHLSCGRRTLLSVFAGTGCYILLLNVVAPLLS